MWLVYKKEMMELLRDKRTLILSILLPTVIFPIIFFFVGKFSGDRAQEASVQEIKIAFVNAEQMPGLKDLFSAEKHFLKVELDSDDYKKLVLDKEVDFIVEIPEGSSAPSQSKVQQTVNLHFKGASSLSNILTKRVNDVFKNYNTVERKKLGDAFNIPNESLKAFNKPIDIADKNYASKREKTGEIAGALIAYVLILLAIAGAMYPTLEVGVGEKERGTLETLLLTPMSKSRIVLAKFGVIFTASFASVAFTLLSYLFWAYIFTNALNLEAIGFLSNISSLDILLIAILLIPLTSIFASIMLCASIYAKNMKEAQAYMSPIMMMGFVPVIVAFVPGMELNWKTALIPVTNVALAMKDLIKGTVDYGMIAVLLLSTALIAGALLYFVTQFFKKEKVLFRS
ncbi:MAG: ABC transporter permease [Gammaproteobacteria bacterium]|nr:ABC transporter permease [Gammaproteobacteria bacterium]